MKRTKKAAETSPLSRSILGDWRLVSCEHIREDGTVEFPFGRAPRGRLVYSASGRMIVLITDPSRTKAKSPQFFEASPDELAAAARGCVAYSGTWTVRGKDVLHAVEQSLFPNWEGNRLVRKAALTGKRLTLSTGPFSIGESRYTAVLVWERDTK